MKNPLHKLISTFLVLILASSVLLTACGKKDSVAASSTNGGMPEVTELRYQGSVWSVTFPELADDLGYLAPLKLNYIGNTISGPARYSGCRDRRYRFWWSV